MIIFNVYIDIKKSLQKLQFLQTCSDRLIFSAIFVGYMFLFLITIDQQRWASQGSLILVLLLKPYCLH